jgi:cell wall-associated NlpC family hydrolase
MANSAGISGIAVAVAAAGGVLVYAGFQGVNPLEALREISAGKPKQLEDTDTTWVHDAMNRLVPVPGVGGALGGGATGGGMVPASYVEGSSTVGNALVQSAMKYKGDIYSGPKRWQKGYSDCSSFVGKSFKDIGITPPGGSLTWDYQAWGKLKTIKMSEIQAGDLLCSAAHIAIAISPTEAIGQQNERRNVQIGPIKSIMANSGKWYPRRYVGQRSVST